MYSHIQRGVIKGELTKFAMTQKYLKEPYLKIESSLKSLKKAKIVVYKR